MIHFDWMNKAVNNSHQTITNQNNWPYPIKSHSIIVTHSSTVSFPCPIFYSFQIYKKLADLMSQTQHCMMLHVVESFCTKFETGLTFSYSMCKQTQQNVRRCWPTMLCPFARGFTAVLLTRFY